MAIIYSKFTQKQHLIMLWYIFLLGITATQFESKPGYAKNAGFWKFNVNKFSISHISLSSCNSLQSISVLHVLVSPELDPALQMWPHQWWAEEKDPLPWPAGNAFHNAAWDALGLVSCKGTLLAPVQLEEPLDPFLKSCFPASLSTVCTDSLAQDLTFPFIELREVSVSLWSKKLAGPNSQAPS